MARLVASWVAETEWAERLHSVEQLETLFREALPTRDAWVTGDPVVGYLSLDPKTYRIGGLYCSTRGQGLGHALMAHAKAGREWLWLHCYERNTRARQFYAREGFVERGRHRPEPPAQLTEIRLEWVRHAQ